VSETEKQLLKSVEIKLENLFNCILDKAASDSEFAYQLEEILSSKSSIGSNKSRIKKRAKKNVFDAPKYLYDNGEIPMREELDKMMDSELKQILQEVSGKKPKDLKNLERQQLMDEIVTNTNRILNQGSSFLQIDNTTESSSNSTSDS
jgi:predicted component of type VI protein secretion system